MYLPLAAPFNGTQLEPLQADDAAQETGADPAAAAAAAEALQLEAAAAIAAQRAGATPESKALWRAEGTAGTSDDSDIVSAAEDSQPDDVDDEADLPSIDSGSGGDAGGDAASPDRDGSGQRSADADAAAQDASGQAGSDGAASGSDSEGGYGAGGLSWEAVMAQMLAQQVCVIVFDSTANFMQFVCMVTIRGVPTALLQVTLAGASRKRNRSKVLPGLQSWYRRLAVGRCKL